MTNGVSRIYHLAKRLIYHLAKRRPAALRAYIEGVETMTKAEVLL